MSYKVGSVELDITPTLGTPLAGYFRERIAEGVIDPLTVNAVVVSDSKEIWALASCDLVGLSLDITNRVRKILSQKVNLKPEQVMVCCTHTHTGPVISANSAPFIEDKTYLDFLISRISDAIIMAKNNTVEVEAFCGRGIVEGVAFNRRFWMKEGVVVTNPGINNPNIIRPAGPIDPELGLIYFREKETGDLISIITNYALHADIISGSLISPDFPGYMRKALQQYIGRKVPVIFTRGSAGDINHIDVNSQPDRLRRCELSEAIGKMMASEVIKTIESPCKERCIGPVWYALNKNIEIPLSSITQAEIEEAQSVLDPANQKCKNTTDLVRARRILRIKETGSQPIKTEVQAIGFGNVAFCGLPAEVFVEIGLEIKDKSQIPFTWVVDLANDKFGYVPTERAFKEGGYEVNSSPLAPQAGNILKTAVLEILSN